MRWVMNKKPNNFKCFAGIKNQEGAVLIAALILLVVVALMVTTLMNWTNMESNRAQSYYESRASFYVAEAGLQRAINGMNYDNAGNNPGWAGNGFDDELTGGLGLNNVDVAGQGTFTATIADNNDDADQTTDVDNAVILVSTGTVDGINSSVEALVYLINAPANPTSALTTNGNMTISGNPTITGACGSAHSNGNFGISGSPNFTGQVTATGTYTNSGGSNPAHADGQDEVDIPDLTPSDYQGDADFELRLDGSVWSGGVMIHADASSTPWNGWDYSSPKWTMAGPNPLDGMYYIEGDAVISSSPGNPGSPWDVSFVATGNIEVSGNPTMSNHMDPGDSTAVQNIFMLAGLDLKYNGNPAVTVTGLLYAHEHIAISGNPDIEGAVMSYWRDGDPALSGWVSQNSMSGNATITFNCNLVIPGPPTSTVGVASWNEL